MNFISCDEVGDRVLGFTVNGQPTANWELPAPSTLVWASPVELLVWLSRTPGYWGDFTTSATFRVWDQGMGQVIETLVPRTASDEVLNRDDLLAS